MGDTIQVLRWSRSVLFEDVSLGCFHILEATYTLYSFVMSFSFLQVSCQIQFLLITMLSSCSLIYIAKKKRERKPIGLTHLSKKDDTISLKGEKRLSFKVQIPTSGPFSHDQDGP